METGGGFVPMEFLLTQAPEFTLYGDGTVIYRQTDTRNNDPMGGQGLLPYLVGHLDEDGIQALLGFALGQGRLLGAREDYQSGGIADAPSTIFTLNAADLQKTVSVNALGMEDPTNPNDAADRQGFVLLQQQLATFEQRGKDGQLGEVTSYDPAFYRVFLLSAEGAQVQPVDWPWDDLTPTDFVVPGADDTRAQKNLDKDHVAKLETVPTGGRAGLYLTGPDGKSLFSVGIRPLFPDDLAAADLN